MGFRIVAIASVAEPVDSAPNSCIGCRLAKDYCREPWSKRLSTITSNAQPQEPMVFVLVVDSIPCARFPNLAPLFVFFSPSLRSSPFLSRSSLSLRLLRCRRVVKTMTTKPSGNSVHRSCFHQPVQLPSKVHVVLGRTKQYRPRKGSL